ncbi:uncharacterized protein DUF4391 [Roseivirga pacifica]|uniref:DUF4391 domain-containing protein n=1 Tax=Roseivirga pacifica TaxID=1267423 RepID=A0A1I0QIF0_9BACT|nr:DUF4391 domain-containing protein [Roseivirga pacifica]RKQ42900.1 uncharacterized protein DUF4391 [Roseivirga pacifica]SEW26669.1 protein of unknown function [Roseivirga pacifica]
MHTFDLPKRTYVDRVIPKNSFDSYCTNKQKQDFTKLISKITWLNKISKQTTNLGSEDIEEIQVFNVELKVNEGVQHLLDVIDKAIPYPIIFIVEHPEKLFVSTSQKHLHPTKPDTSVIDHTIAKTIQTISEITIQLTGSLDQVYKSIYNSLSSISSVGKNIETVIDFEQKKARLEKEISTLKGKISREKQFNRRLEYNQLLNTAKQELEILLGSQ